MYIYIHIYIYVRMVSKYVQLCMYIYIYMYETLYLYIYICSNNNLRNKSGSAQRPMGGSSVLAGIQPMASEDVAPQLQIGKIYSKITSKKGGFNGI